MTHTLETQIDFTSTTGRPQVYEGTDQTAVTPIEGDWYFRTDDNSLYLGTLGGWELLRNSDGASTGIVIPEWQAGSYDYLTIVWYEGELAVSLTGTSAEPKTNGTPSADWVTGLKVGDKIDVESLLGVPVITVPLPNPDTTGDHATYVIKPATVTPAAYTPWIKSIKKDPNGSTFDVDYEVDTGTSLVVATLVVNISGGLPTITIVGSTPVTVLENTTYTDEGATASDPEDGDITANIVTTSNVDTAVVGAYTVVYDVADIDGNTDQKTRDVDVVASCTGVTVPDPVVETFGYNFVASTSAIDPGSYDLALGTDNSMYKLCTNAGGDVGLFKATGGNGTEVFVFDFGESWGTLQNILGKTNAAELVIRKSQQPNTLRRFNYTGTQLGSDIILSSTYDNKDLQFLDSSDNLWVHMSNNLWHVLDSIDYTNLLYTRQLGNHSTGFHTPTQARFHPVNNQVLYIKNDDYIVCCDGTTGDKVYETDISTAAIANGTDTYLLGLYFDSSDVLQGIKHRSTDDANFPNDHDTHRGYELTEGAIPCA